MVFRSSQCTYLYVPGASFVTHRRNVKSYQGVATMLGRVNLLAVLVCFFAQYEK